MPTTYTLDLNAGLTQVLADGANTYLYGPMRIGEQQPGGFAYHLPDTLGSVRQVANASGAVTLARTYEPFGSVMSTSGSGNSIFGWAGEARDATGLVFLRARYYHPGIGRFFVRDAWPGNTQMPGTLHPYLYGLDNPINHADPSGQVCILGLNVNWLPGRSCTDQDRQNAISTFRTIGTHIQFQTGFYLELIDSLAAGVPGLALRIADQLIDPSSELYQLLGFGCDEPSLTFYKARVLNNSDPYFQMGRLGGRLVALGIGIGEFGGGLAGGAGSVALALPTGGGSVITLAGSAVLVGHGGAVVAGVIAKEAIDPLISKAGIIIARAVGATAGGGGSGNSSGGGGEGQLTREEVIEAVKEVVGPKVGRIKSIAGDNAAVGFRGSLARGTVGNRNKPTYGQPVDLSNFDIDAFIVSDKLASQFPRSLRFRDAGRVARLKAIQEEIEAALRARPEFVGLRAEPFTFRVFTKAEAAQQFSGYEIYFGGP